MIFFSIQTSTKFVSDLLLNVTLKTRVYNVLVMNYNFKCIQKINATAIRNLMLNVSTSQIIDII